MIEVNCSAKVLLGPFPGRGPDFIATNGKLSIKELLKTI